MSTFTSSQPAVAVCPETPFAPGSGAPLGAVGAKPASPPLPHLIPYLPTSPTLTLGRFLPGA